MGKSWLPFSSFILKSHFNSMDKLFLTEFIYKPMTWFVSSLWWCFCNFMFKIFIFLETHIDRMVDCDYGEKNLETDEIKERKDFVEKGVETECSVFKQSKFQYIYEENAFGFMEKPEAKSFAIQEMFVNFNGGERDEELELDHHPGFTQGPGKGRTPMGYDHSPINEDKLFHFSFFNDGSVIHREHVQKVANDQEKAEDHVESEEILKENDEVFSDKETENLEDICYEIELLPKIQSLCRNSIRGSDTIVDEDCNTSDESCSDTHLNGFLNVIEENDDMGFIELEPPLVNLSSTDKDDCASKNDDRVEQTDVNCEEMKLIDDLQEFSDHNSSRKSWDADEFDPKLVDVVEETDLNFEQMKLDDLEEFSEHSSSLKSWDTDSDEEDDECDILLEHQNLVKQMKMEMKNSRIAGLPTISEDSESPKVVEDLKPLKIDEKVEYKDCMEEIQKFYKSYAEKMRKLDILNYQTLNALSFLQRKDSEVFMSSKKSSISITKAFTLPNFLANKQRKIFADPALKSISEMNRDLEIVYVGQICLTWGILSWQYDKAKELLQRDPQEYHSYNQAAGEYQQFQVLLQRFVEDEPFQGPRVQNYVRKRCMVRSFLQVPSIRDDRSKEKQGGHGGEKDVITIVKLAEIINETMHVFSEFLRADRREANLALKGVQGTQMDTEEMELFMDIKSDLQKKERKLKDVQRSGNCIVKKFQKQQEGRLSHSLFTSLVELKLVSRVLSLPRLKRDHLDWCQKKLSNINVVGRKVSMETSFSLFPC